MNLTKNVKWTRVQNAVAAGTATTNTSSIDMQGYESATFMISIGAVVSSGTVTAHIATSSDDSTFNDVEGTSIAWTDADDNKVGDRIGKAARAVLAL